MSVHKIARNTVVLTIGKLLCGVLSFLTFVVMARYLGVEKSGIFLYASALIAIFNIFCVFGLDTVLIREISRRPHDLPRLLGSGTVLRCGIALLGFGLTGAFAFTAMKDALSIKTIMILSISLLMTPLQLPRVVFEAQLKAHYVVMVELTTRILAFVLVCAVCQYHLSLIAMAWTSVGADLAGILLLLGLALRKAILTLKPDVATMCWLFKEIWPLAVTSISGMIYFRIDTVLLGFFRGHEDVAFYNSAYAIMSALLFLPEAYSRSIFPAMSEAFNSSKDRMLLIFTRSFKYLISIAVPVGVLGVLYARDIIRLFFGPAFTPAAESLKVLFVAASVIFLSFLVSTSINAMNHQKVNMAFAGSIAGLNIALNLIAIPLWGYLGASWTTLITEGVGCILALTFNCRFFHLKFKGISSIRIGALAASLFLMVLATRFLSGWPVLLAMAVGLFLFFALLLVLRWFDRTDKELFLQIFRSVR